ncbi:F-box/kelch-repeat protein SKIP25 [Striga asiatica]|uniref:F-box/kelch-repeat protein SKIP25 n=1 Tax=Striga asiatica TaxID=4170 RepID=A0A5A7P6Q0_STRAF|nr:F-box/kelch-repeat protein SKIP25 [Striga asiatica]
MTNPVSSDPEFSARSTAIKLYHHGGDNNHHHQSLLPGLPDDIAQLCLSLVPPSILYSVCRSWRRLINSASFPAYLSLYAVVLPESQSQLQPIPDPVDFYSFDPISRLWSSLPPPPSDPPPRFLFRHPAFIRRNLPIQSISAAGKLVVLAATDDQFLPALPHPLLFDPLSGRWNRGPRLAAPRRWCAAGEAGGEVYVASGIGAGYSCDVARSIERWNLKLDPDTEPAAAKRRRRTPPAWRRLANLKDGKFSRDAIEAVGWRGRLCMVNVKGTAAKDGLVYDVARDCWRGMPEGMLAGWRGPAAAMNEETIYAVDEGRGLLRRYDGDRDSWEDVAGCGLFQGAEQVAAGGGRVCVLCAEGTRIVVVDVASPPPVRMWVEEVPSRLQVVGIHILPRLVR